MSPTASASTSASATPTPALKPPAGTTSNFDHPQSLAVYGDITIGICAPLVTIFFALRSYVRIRYKKVWNTEDWLVFASWGGTIGFFGILGATMANHGGEHLWDITKEEAKSVAYWFNVAAIEYAVIICLTKISILWLYRRAFSPRKGSAFEISVFVLITAFVIFYGATALAKVFECTPRAKILDNSIPGHCIKLSAVLTADGVFNTVTDFVILLMPTMAIYRLQMQPKRKVAIIMIFTFGLSAPIFSTIGFIVRLRLGSNPDTSWNQPAILLWGAAELTTATMCVCIPEFGLLFNRKQRPNKGPTASVLNGAREAIARSRDRTRPSPFSARQLTDSDTGLVGANPYIELDEEHGHHTKVSSTSDGAPAEVPQGSVHVRYDVKVETQ